MTRTLRNRSPSHLGTFRLADPDPIAPVDYGTPVIINTAFTVQDNIDLMRVLLHYANITPISSSVMAAGGTSMFSVLAKLSEELQAFLDMVSNDANAVIWFEQFTGMLHSYGRSRGTTFPMLDHFMRHTALPTDPEFVAALRLHIEKASTGVGEELKFVRIHCESSFMQLRTESDYELQTTWQDSSIESYNNGGGAVFLTKLEEVLINADLVIVPSDVFMWLGALWLDRNHDQPVVPTLPAGRGCKAIAAMLRKELKFDTILVIDDDRHGAEWPLVARKYYEQNQV